MSDLLTRVYLLFCKVGLHQWIYGEGYVALSKDVSFEHNGYRCVWCGKCKKGKRPQPQKEQP